jgi:anaerobic ribonucleoside-triphosphate reductase
MDMVNKAFLEIFLEGDANGRGFQYPIPTYSITKDFDWSETENNKLLFDLTAKYGTPYFSNYINSSMNPSDCRSMCPLTSDTEILVKNSRDGIVVRKIGTLYDGYNLKKTNYLFWNGHKWVSGHPVQMPMTPVFKIVLSNGTTVKMGENHLQPTKDRGTLKASDLEVGDWLPFNKTPIETERLGDSDLGFAIGAYAGDGSHDEGAVVYSLNVDVDQDTVSRLTAFWNRVGYPVKTTVSEKVEYVRVDKNPFAIVSEYIDGDALTKKLSNRCFNASNEFKEGFISGLRASDGSKEKKRIYTSSETMKNDVMKLLASMGHKALSNYVDNRESRLSDKPNYRIDFPDRERYGELFDQDDSYNYYKIVSIEKTNDASSDFLYCLEIDSDDHVFALASGLMTHNCRLRLDLRELRKRNGGFFGAGESTGSIGVVTINMPRIGYLAADKDDFYARLDHMMDIAARSLEIKRKTITDLYNRGLYPYTKRYLGETAFKNHFSTIGLVGMNEACLNAKWLKDDLTHKDAQDFTVEVLNHMRNRLSDYQVQYPSTLFNLEATPAESTCVSGDTNVWTDKGRMTVNDIIADKNKNIGIMSFNAETNSVEFKKLVDCWKTKKDAEVMKITFSNGDSVKVTPNHKMAKRFVTGCGPSRKCWIDYVEAGSLKVGDRLFACHVYTKNSKAYGETYRNVECVLGKNKGSFPMHRLLAEYYYGKIPDGFVVHHKDFDKTNNAKDNLEIMSDADHRRLHEHDEGRNFVRCVDGSANPFFGKHHTEKSKELISETKRETKDEWYPKFLENMASEDTRRKMSEGNKKKSFEQYSRYMPECSTEAIIAKWKENKSIGEIAKELGEPYTYSLVKSRLKHAGLLPNHQIVKIEYLTEREDVYDLEVEGNHNFFISGGVDDAVLVHNCFRLAKHDKEMYPDIITAGKSGETPYYTNSSHLPVGYTDDMFSALDVEDRFQTLYTSGTVFHAFLGQRLPDWHSCMRLVRKIAENYKLPYFTMSPTYSICPDHGYIVGEKWKCPICGKETEVYSRITGYYRPLKNWNAGKMQEFHDRKEYDSSKEEVHDGCNACSLENKNISAEAPKVDHLMLFTNPTCPNCKMAKMLLDKAGIKYDNIDASTHLDQVNAFGITAAPTMIVPDGASFDVYRNASEIAGWIKSRSNA